MPDSKVEVVISAKDQASKVFKGVGNSAADLAKTLTVGIAGGAAALAAGLGVAAKSAADFDKQMSAVKAVSGATADEMKQLSGLALKLGKDTSFSASEAAQGLEELVKGGISIPDIMNGAAEATLNLAAAGGVDLRTAAEIASNAINTFNLSGADMAHVSDMIAGAANASAIDVTDFQLSLAAAGAVTKTVGGTFDDLSVAITAMGNAGIKGSDAGTSLKTMLLNLQPATKEQKSLMQQLGLITATGANQFFDATGKIKSFADVAGVLQNALKGQTDAQKLATLETLFGSDAIRAASVFAEQGAEGFQNLTDKISGISAADVAATRLDNLAGDLEQLKGSAETAAITFGETFQEPLRKATQSVTGFINDAVIPFINEHGPGFAEAVTKAGQGLVSGAGNLLDSTKRVANEGLQVLRDKLDETGKAWAPWAKEAGEAGKVASDGLSGVSGAALALQLLLQGNFKGAMAEGERSLNNFGGAADHAALAVRDVKKAIEELSSTKTLVSDVEKAFASVGRTLENVGAFLPSLIGNLLKVAGGAAVAGEKTDFWSAAIHTALAPILALLGNVERMSGALRRLGDMFNALGEVIRTVSSLFATPEKAMQTLGQAADILGAAFGALATTVGEALGGMFDAIVSTLRQSVAAFDTWRGQVGESLAATATAVVSQATAIGTAIVDGIRGGITAGAQSVANAAASTAKAALDAAKAALGISSPSVEFHLVGMDATEGFADGLEDGASDVEDAAESMADDLLEAIQDAEPAAAVAGYDLGASVSAAIGAGLGKVKLVQAGADLLKGTVAGAMRDLADSVGQINDDVSRRMADVGRRAAEAFEQATRDAERGIAAAIQDADQRISDMIDNLDLSRQLRGRRGEFAAGQSEASLARSRGRELEDIQRSRNREDKANADQLARDIARARTAEERAGILQRYADAQDDLKRRRTAEDEERAYRQQREDEDRAYARKQEEERQAFEDNLDDEALARSIQRTKDDRDNRVKQIQDALHEKQQKIQADAEEEKQKLAQSAADRIQILKDDFIAQLPPLTEEASRITEEFLAGIDQGIQNLISAAHAAAAAIANIPSAPHATQPAPEPTPEPTPEEPPPDDYREPQPGPETNLDPIQHGPVMDKGGVVTGPAWVKVGSGVREAFTPLAGGVRPQGDINVTVMGSVLTENELVEIIHSGLLRKERSNGTLFRT